MKERGLDAAMRRQVETNWAAEVRRRWLLPSSPPTSPILVPARANAKKKRPSVEQIERLERYETSSRRRLGSAPNSSLV